MSAEKHTDKYLALKEQAAALPLLPGVYRFVDAEGTVLYVGKAKSLRKRVANYFVDSRLPSKIRVMVRRAVELRHIVTDSETDALLLENSLIKRLQPRYNAMLKDDKTYPWITIRSEPFPRILSTRRVVRDGSLYFGPYASIGVQRNLLEILHAVFLFRTCKLDLAPEKIAKGKYRPCLQYHLGNCRGPCVGRQSEAEYTAGVEMARSMLRGELGPIRRALTAAMKQASSELAFEAAAGYKHRLDLLEGYSSRSVVASSSLGDVDVFALVADDDAAWCNFVRTVRGTIINSFTVQLSLGAEEDPKTILTTAIEQISGLLQKSVGAPQGGVGGAENLLAKNIVVPFLPETALFPDNVFTVPQRGEKKELLEFAEKNARLYRAEQLKNLEIKDPEKAVNRVMEAMQKELRLPREPRWIECFDNSNLQGTNAVAACVVFRDGKPSRKEYRHFNIKTVEGPDDYASMREIVTRRYTRLLSQESGVRSQESANAGGKLGDEAIRRLDDGANATQISAPPTAPSGGADGFYEAEKPAALPLDGLITHDSLLMTPDSSLITLPDLVVIDGGKGQLNVAYSVFQELGIADKVPLVALAERIEEVFFPGDPTPYYLKKNGEPLRVLIHIRDEAHRFGITFHRSKRSAAFIHSELENIPGIGPRTIEALLGRFKTVKAVREASVETLAGVVGAARAKTIREYFGA